LEQNKNKIRWRRTRVNVMPEHELSHLVGIESK